MEINALKKKRDNYNCFFSMDELVGKRFGHWTVLSECNYRTKGGNKIKAYNCVCDCGTKRVVLKQSLLRGVSQSCGCSINHIRDEEKHSFWDSRISNIYCSMIARCYNPSSTSYSRYGGRGICVCDEWRGENGKTNFFRWAIKNGYSDELSLDRIDNDGDYTPTNCRWATIEEQSSNRRTNLYLTYNGETKTYTQWARQIGLKTGDAIKYRIKRGWTIEAAVTTPSSKPYTFIKRKQRTL